MRLVRDLLTVGVPTCRPDTPVREIARRLLREDRVDSLVVVAPNGHAVGVVGWDELAEIYTRPEEWDSLVAEDVMNPEVPTVPPDIPVSAAAQMMRDRNVRTLYITHHARGIEYPSAVIGFWHLARHIAAESEDDISDLGMGAPRKSPIERFKEKRDRRRREAGLD